MSATVFMHEAFPPYVTSRDIKQDIKCTPYKKRGEKGNRAVFFLLILICLWTLLSLKETPLMFSPVRRALIHWGIVYPRISLSVLESVWYCFALQEPLNILYTREKSEWLIAKISFPWETALALAVVSSIQFSWAECDIFNTVVWGFSLHASEPSCL